MSSCHCIYCEYSNDLIDKNGLLRDRYCEDLMICWCCNNRTICYFACLECDDNMFMCYDCFTNISKCEKCSIKEILNQFLIRELNNIITNYI